MSDQYVISRRSALGVFGAGSAAVALAACSTSNSNGGGGSDRRNVTITAAR